MAGMGVEASGGTSVGRQGWSGWWAWRKYMVQGCREEGQGGKVSWERSQCLDSPPSEHVLLTATLYWHFLQASAILHTSHRLTH